METRDQPPTEPDTPTDLEIAHIFRVARETARRIGTDRCELDDIVQQTAVKIWRRWNTPTIRMIRNGADHRWDAYIRRTARNAHLDSIRGRQRRQERNTRAADPIAATKPRLTAGRPGTVAQTPQDPDLLFDHLAQQAILEQFNTLPPRQRIVAWLILVEELSNREVAKALKIQPQAVRKHLRAAKAKLIEQIAEPTHQSLQ